MAHRTFVDPTVPWAEHDNEMTVLNYFKSSEGVFCSTECNNHLLRVNEGIQSLDKMEGPEYRVDHSMSDRPWLWVVRYQWRSRGSAAPELMKLYYMIHGVWYEVCKCVYVGVSSSAHHRRWAGSHSSPSGRRAAVKNHPSTRHGLRSRQRNLRYRQQRASPARTCF